MTQSHVWQIRGVVCIISTDMCLHNNSSSESIVNLSEFTEQVDNAAEKANFHAVQTRGFCRCLKKTSFWKRLTWRDGGSICNVDCLICWSSQVQKTFLCAPLLMLISVCFLAFSKPGSSVPLNCCGLSVLKFQWKQNSCLPCICPSSWWSMEALRSVPGQQSHLLLAHQKSVQSLKVKERQVVNTRQGKRYLCRSQRNHYKVRKIRIYWFWNPNFVTLTRVQFFCPKTRRDGGR